MNNLPVLMWLLSGFALAACEPSEEQAGTAPPPQVTVASPIHKEITEWDEFTGRFEAIEEVDVRARVSGLIKKVHFKDGQLVQPDDLLFTLDKRPFQISVDRATALRDQATATLELTKLETARARPLVKRRAMSQRELDTRLAKQQEAKAALSASEADLEQAELELDWAEVRAPIAGRISESLLDEGNLISGGATNSTVLTTIVSLNPIHFVFEGSERDYLKYIRLERAGKRASSRDTPNPVRIKLADEKRFEHKGNMDFVDNVVDPQSGTIRGRAVVHNADLIILPGVFGRLRLFGGKAMALLIPDEAIASDQGRKVVMTVGKDDIVAPKVVSLGPMVGGLRVVRSGIGPKDRIIIKGVQRVRPGQKVSPQAGKVALMPTPLKAK